MKQKFGRVVALALALVMVCSVVFVPAYAAAGAEGDALTPAPVSEPQPEQTPQPESEEAPETPVNPEEPVTPTEPKTDEPVNPEEPKQDEPVTPDEPKTPETPEAPKDDNTIIVPPAEETPSILIPGEEMLEQPEGAQTPENGETAPQTAQEYLSKISVYQGEYNYLNFQKQFGLITDEAYAEGCQALYLSLGELLAQAADTLTEEDLAQIEAVAEPLLAEVGQIIGADQPELLAPPQRGVTHKFDFVLKGIDIAYIFYDQNDQPAVDKLNPQEVVGDETTGNAPTVEIFQAQGSGKAYIVFFIKPKDGYLLTSWGGSATGYNAFDFYSIDTPVSESQIPYPNLQAYVTAMSKQGYVGYYGFTLSSESKTEYTSKLTGEKPTLEVTATTGLDQVKPDEYATFTVTIKPGVTSVYYEVEDLRIDKLTINKRGQGEDDSITYGKPTPKGDGTYTLDVTYRVTSDDFERGTVDLYVEASIDYKKEFEVEDTVGLTSNITTSATVSGKADETIPIVSNPRYVVSYDPKLELSKEVEEATKAPLSDKNYKKGEMVDIQYYDETEVPDDKNGGTWTFDGWYLTENLGEEDQRYGKDSTYEMVSDKVTFYGKWTFTANAVDVTIGKHVVGNMGDHKKSFDFTYIIKDKDKNELRLTPVGYDEAADDETPLSFTLVSGTDVTFENVPVGATITITEKEDSRTGYENFYQIGSLDYDKDSANPGYKVENYTVQPLKTVTDEDGVEKKVNPNQILFINVKDITPDTGISLDSLPYILMLTAAGAAGLFLALRRRHSSEF